MIRYGTVSLSLMLLAGFAPATPTYKATGDARDCVQVRSIRSTNAISESTIIFRMTDKSLYRNDLPAGCPRLKADNRISYRVTTGSLCQGDTVTVFDSFGNEWASCGLGRYTPVELVKTADPN